jgi:hypothetical protein
LFFSYDNDTTNNYNNNDNQQQNDFQYGTNNDQQTGNTDAGQVDYGSGSGSYDGGGKND